MTPNRMPSPGPPPTLATIPPRSSMAQTRPFQNHLLFIYGTSLGIGLHIALIHLVLTRSVPGAAFVVASSAVYGTLTFVLWKWMLPRFSSYRVSRRLFYQSLVTLLCVSALSVMLVEAHGLVFGTASIFRQYDGGPLTITISAEGVRRGPVFYALIPIIPTVVLCVLGFNQHWWRLYVLQGRQQALEELALSAQLAALRAQVNPHFLFNSLNSIAQLISSDPAKAEACVERLGEIFRYVLTRSHRELVPLSEELDVAEAYLEIERARFGEDLVVRQAVQTEARQVLLPGFILQPLVENAVKHGISRKIGGGEVSIEARLDNGDLHLAVRDTGIGVSDEASMFERGVGLRNVRDRLLHLYGAEYVPRVVSRSGEGTTVALRIPVASGTAPER